MLVCKPIDPLFLASSLHLHFPHPRPVGVGPKSVDSNDTEISYQYMQNRIMPGIINTLNGRTRPFIEDNEPKLAINPLIHHFDVIHEGGKREEETTNNSLKWTDRERSFDS